MFGKSRGKPRSLGFKETSKVIKKQLRAARKIKNPETRLAKYQELKADLYEVLDNTDKDIQRAVEKPNPKKDGFFASATEPNFGTMVIFGTVLFPPIYSIAVLSVLAYILAPASILVTAGFMFGCRHMLRRRRAKELGMTIKDVKYAQKMKKQQTRVDQAIKALNLTDAEKSEVEKLTALREKYNPHAGKKPAPANDTAATAAKPVTPQASAPAP